jgi:hypothetical protein
VVLTSIIRCSSRASYYECAWRSAKQGARSGNILALCFLLPAPHAQHLARLPVRLTLLRKGPWSLDGVLGALHA